MSIMSRFEYLAELNQRLMVHADYQPGMEFVFAPPGATAETATGYAWVPQEGSEPMRSIAVETSKQINVA